MPISGMHQLHPVEQCITSNAALPVSLSCSLEAAHQNADMTSKHNCPCCCNALDMVSDISSHEPICIAVTQPEFVQQDADMTIKHNQPCYQMSSPWSQTTSSAVGPPASLSRTLGLRSRRQAHCRWGSRASGVSKPGRGEGSFMRHDTAPSRSLSQLSTAAPNKKQRKD